MLRKLASTTPSRNEEVTPSHAIIENTISHNAEMTSTIKAKICCFFGTIIKWCHIIA